jgi:RNA polymerase sigma-70 factor (ECF subfamily)
MPEYPGMVPTNDQRHEQFLRDFMPHAMALRSFVRSLVPTVQDADDVMQEVAIVLWQRSGERPDGVDFRPWAFGVAKFKVLSWRRDRQRERNRHMVDEQVIELLATEAGTDAHVARLAAQREALHDCLARLPADKREFLTQAYAAGGSIEELAQAVGQTAMTFYKRLHRLRMALVTCTRAALQRDGWA